MSSGPQRARPHSLLYRDLASPISHHRHRAGAGGSTRFSTPSALWRDSLASSSSTIDPPPPPVFTLDDRSIDFSPTELLPSPPSPPHSPRSPQHTLPRTFSSPSSSFKLRRGDSGGSGAHTTPGKTSSFKIYGERSGSGGGGVANGTHQMATEGWWSPAKGVGESAEKGKEGSPVDGVVQQQQTAGMLLALPPSREVARPELEKSAAPSLMGGGIVEKEWVTVFGFSPGDTNLVIREFEKCGVILKHIPGPRDSNWMHLLYQNRYDARKAIGKNGTQINSLLIIGVKHVDPIHLQYLNERLNNNHVGFMVSLPPRSQVGASVRPSYVQNGVTTTTDGAHRTSAIATPTKSVVSKVMDLMFGI